MKKKICIYIIIFIVIVLIALISVYLTNYKSADEMQELLSKSDKISNMYVAHCVTYDDYSDNIKDYKVDIYVKDNVYIYYVLGRIDYANFNTKECYTRFEDGEKGEVDINNVNKFNDYSMYFNLNEYTYSYVFPCYINNNWCDKVVFKENNRDYKVVLYVNKSNGLVMKEIHGDTVETFDYQFDVVTDKQMEL